MTQIDAVTAFAAKNKLEVVSDLHGRYFAVKNSDDHFIVARFQGNEIVLGKAHYATKEGAMAQVHKTGGVVTERMASLTDQEVINRVVPQLGLKASDHSYGGYVVVSAPIQDRNRRWQYAKRVGAGLVIDKGTFPDRWAARARAQKLGGEKPTETLAGPHMFPYGNNFAAPRAKA